MVDGLNALKDYLNSRLLGQEEAVQLLLVGLLANGHLLIEGPPGVGKTQLARSTAQALGLSLRRVQFTPDLLPSDITGINILDTQRSEFKFCPGPIFTQLLLADELNRAPARTQAALLEAMQEGQVTIDGTSHRLLSEFTVIATQNPLEYEGTYGLPEAQLDRFLLCIKMGYPGKTHARELLEKKEALLEEELNLGKSIREMREKVEEIRTEAPLLDYINEIIHASREMSEVALGASPRAALMLLRAVKAYAYINNRAYGIPEDVQDLLLPVLGHRLMLSPEAKIEGIKPADCIKKLLRKVAVPR